jgi:hypothetical protein
MRAQMKQAKQRVAPKHPHKPSSMRLGARPPDWDGIDARDPRSPWYRDPRHWLWAPARAFVTHATG